jgi:hypothetical protein
VEIEPVTGVPVRIPPGRVAIRLDERHKSAYRALYARYRTVLDGLPVLRERDFDGRAVKVTPAQLEALNRAFASLDAAEQSPANVFDAQERSRQRLFKRLQYLS